VWPLASDLIEQLELLERSSADSSFWARSVIAQLERLSTLDSLSSGDARQTLQSLHDLAEPVRDAAAPNLPSRDRTLRLRAGYGLVRRLALWDTVSEIAEHPASSTVPSLDSAALSAAVHNVETLLSKSAAGKPWRTYLRYNELRALDASLTQDQRELARDVLRRLDSARLDEHQHRFLSSPPFQKLAAALRPAVQEEVGLSELLQAVEEHEAGSDSLTSGRIAGIYQVMRWSLDDRTIQLADLLNSNYRNANVRVAISAELLNRFVPGPQMIAEPVVDNIRGADVVGRSESLTRLRIVLLPDRLRWRLGLEARGAVASETESSKGPARFWNDGLGEFNARKLITVDRRGMSVASAEAQANANSHLRDFETDYDPIPLFGPLARSIARQQYEDERQSAQSEIERKISWKASSRLNHEVDSRIAQAEQEFQQKLLLPLDRLNLEPTPVAMETTDRRLIVRYRLAGPHQISAHTPRPQAPGNSLLSLQLHESVLNNSLENLKLDNRRVELRTLYVEMLRRFDTKPVSIPEDLPENVTVHFAEHDAVRIANEDGRVKLTIRLKELNHADEHVWHNFQVTAYYRPSDDQLEANLVRDGILELSGERLHQRDRFALRTIFAKVLSKNRRLSLVNRQLLMRPQLADLQVTQFIVQDGWIGVALGPKSDNMRPAPVPSEPEHEVTRRPLRNLFPGHR
jgi:hypothetical protein